MPQLHLPFPVPVEMERAYRLLQELQRAQMSRATAIGYAHDWRVFCAWCSRSQRAALPASPETLALFLADQLNGGKKVASVYRYAAGVAATHRLKGLPSPLTESVRGALWGARRLRHEPLRQMRPLTLAQLQEIAGVLAEKDTPLADRDRAIVVIGFASALRRSNLASIELDDVTFCRQGLTLRVRREKQDQGGRGRTIAVPFGAQQTSCPVRCLEAWLQRRGRAPGPLFTRLDSARKSDLDPLSVNAIWVIVRCASA